ncbi:MAG: hypothetical protein U9N73_07450 [Candidatus Auribacterota bacterium]|nr:hypothetical protein [Candidatus Auribacterota bacterium]
MVFLLVWGSNAVRADAFQWGRNLKEEIEDEREQFDKKIDFELSELQGFVGLKF